MERYKSRGSKVFSRSIPYDVNAEQKNLNETYERHDFNFEIIFAGL